MKRLLLLVAAAPALLAQISTRPADAIVPVVGSTEGQSGALFRTELQLSNPTNSDIGGWIVLHPGGHYLRYHIEPRSTLSWEDVVGAMFLSGLFSLDVLADNGTLPVIVTRAYDDQGLGTTGVGVPAMKPAEALVREESGILIVPRDLTRYRFNIGARALGSGATLELAVRSASGLQRGSRTVTLTEDELRQQPAHVFVGTAVGPDESIRVTVMAGSVIVYATTVDNVTNDGSLQILRR